jgi:hypothetical protein
VLELVGNIHHEGIRRIRLFHQQLRNQNHGLVGNAGFYWGGWWGGGGVGSDSAEIILRKKYGKGERNRGKKLKKTEERGKIQTKSKG